MTAARQTEAPGHRPQRRWLPPLLACAASALILAIAPPIPLLIALPLLLLVAVGTWKQVLACGAAVAAATYVLVDVPDRVVVPGTVAEVVLAAAVSAAVVAWLRERHLDVHGSARVASAGVFWQDGCQPLGNGPRMVALPGAGVLLWAPEAGRTRALVVAGDWMLPAGSSTGVFLALQGPMPLTAAADLIHAELVGQHGRGDPQVTVMEIDQAHQVGVAARGGPPVLHLGTGGTDVVSSTATGVVRCDIARDDRVAVLLGAGAFDQTWTASLPDARSVPLDVAAARLLAFASEIDAPHEALLLLELQ